MISKRVANLKESATLKINAVVNALKAEGKIIYNFTAGEPDFAPPEAAKNAVIDAVAKNLSKYTPTAGIPALRELVARKTNLQQPRLSLDRPWKSSNVVVSNGGKQAIFDAILSLIDPGDEVVLGSPYWLSYPEMVQVAEGVCRVIPTAFEQDFKFDPQQLKSVLNEKTKLLILNSPSNPTGSIYSQDELKAFGEVLKSYPRVWILSDEIYDLIDFDHKWVSFLEVNPFLRDRTVTVNGLSKSGSMTGWRIGWSVAPENLTAALISLQGHSTSGISSLSQAAAVAVLKLPTENFAGQLKEYLNRRSLALEVLRKSAKIKVSEPSGAFYLFLDISKVLKENQDANGFAENVLRDVQVAVVSGVDFGLRNVFVSVSQLMRTRYKSGANGSLIIAIVCSSSLLSCGKPAFDIEDEGSRAAAIIDIENALTRSNCVDALAISTALYQSVYSDNEIRMLYASSHACNIGIQMYPLLDQISTADFGSVSKIFQALVMLFPSSITSDSKVQSAGFASDALLAILKPGVAVGASDRFYELTHNPGSVLYRDRTIDANSYLLFISMAVVGTTLNRYGYTAGQSPVGLGYAQGQDLPWITKTLVKNDTTGSACGLASGLLNLLDSITATGSLLPSSVSGAFTNVSTLLTALIVNAASTWCTVTDGYSVAQCNAAVARLRFRGACAEQDQAASAASGIINAINAGWL